MEKIKSLFAPDVIFLFVVATIAASLIWLLAQSLYTDMYVYPSYRYEISVVGDEDLFDDGSIYYCNNFEYNYELILLLDCANGKNVKLYNVDISVVEQ